MFRTLAFTIKIFVSYLIFKNYLLFIWNSNNWLSSIYSGNPNKVVFQVDRGKKGFFGSHSTFLFFNKSNIYSLGRTFKQYFFFFFWLRCSGCGILVLWSNIEPVPSALEAQSLNPWTTRQVPPFKQYGAEAWFYISSFLPHRPLCWRCHAHRFPPSFNGCLIFHCVPVVVWTSLGLRFWLVQIMLPRHSLDISMWLWECNCR